MNNKAGTVSLSVTQLAAFACRQGDLFPDGVAGPTAREGIRAHVRLQEKRKTAAAHAQWLRSEVSVSCQSEVDGTLIHLTGRIDLVDTLHNRLTEIKTTLVPSHRLPESQRAVQWAQAYLYGYVYLQTLQQQKPTDRHLLPQALDIELVHLNIRDGAESSEVRSVPSAELTEYAAVALSAYAGWTAKIERQRQAMMSSAATLDFPFGHFRDGQRDMAVAIYRASRDAKPLMCEAATGLGKTMSSLYPAIKSMGEGTVLQLVYLTAKVEGRRSADDAMHTLRSNGLVVTSIQIRAKGTSCFCSTGRCQRDESGRCPMTLGFFDRLPQARDELLSVGNMENDILDEVAWSHQLCPFELALQMLPWVQVVLADFNYVFDPLVKLAHFSGGRKDTVLLVDEAHNLVDRSRSMYSATLDRVQCMDAAAECRLKHPPVARQLDVLSRRLLELPGDAVEAVVSFVEAPAKLARAVSSAMQSISEHILPIEPLAEKTAELWLALCRYAAINELYSEQHRCLVSCTALGRRRQVTVQLYCFDASQYLASCYGRFRATVLFSATLRPGAFFRDTLGLANETGYLRLRSPFKAENCLHAIVDWVDTRYHHRQASMDLLVNLINESTADRLGNYLVFFPSYAYLEQVHARFVERYPHRATWVQSRSQDREEHRVLIDSFDTAAHRIGFAIQGGVFGEGIDYRGRRLIGALIIGAGLPATDYRTDLIAEHYEQSGRNGYDFAYRYPGFTRVLQTAGRVIRGETDTGFVLFVDSRFKLSVYRRLFPDDWEILCPRDVQTLASSLKQFWAKVTTAQAISRFDEPIE